MNNTERIVKTEQLRHLAIEVESANRLAELYSNIAEKSKDDESLSAQHLIMSKTYAKNREKYAHQFKQLAKELYESI